MGDCFFNSPEKVKFFKKDFFSKQEQSREMRNVYYLRLSKITEYDPFY